MAKFKELQRKKIEHEEIDSDTSADEELLTELLDEITAELNTYDQYDKEIKENKPTARDKFFELLTFKVRIENALATETVSFSVESVGDSMDAVEAAILRDYPEYEMLNITRDEDDWTVELQENPSVIKTGYVNRTLGKAFGRTYAVVGASFDVAKFVNEHPELAAKCVSFTQMFTYAPGEWEGDGEAMPVSYKLDEKLATKLMADDPDNVAVFQQYTKPGKVQMRLLPIKDATSEDLA
jgi:hypothetical protein